MSILPKATGFVYLLTDGEFYKIGHASDVKARIARLQTANARQIVLIASFPSAYPQKDEKEIHQEMKQFRVNREWFALPESILSRLDKWFYSKYKPVDVEEVKPTKARKHDLLQTLAMLPQQGIRKGLLTEMSECAREEIDGDFAYQMTLKRSHAAFMRQGLSYEEASFALQQLIDKHEQSGGD